MVPSIKLTYFDIEGRAEPVRLALALTGTDFEDERIAFADWAALKPKMPYGKLPVMTIDGGPMMTQSEAMLRYVGREYSSSKLYPASLAYPIDEAIGLVNDFQNAWAPNLYMGMRPQAFGHAENYAQTEQGKAKIKEMRQAFVEKDLPQWLTYFENTMTKNSNDGTWLASSADHGPTIADCMLVPTLRAFTRGHMDYVPTDCLDSHPKIVEYIKRFCALEPIQGRYADSGIH